MKTGFLRTMALATGLALPALAAADDYVIDTAKAHAFIQFRIQHLGYSWLYGRFNEFSGRFSYDEKNPSAATVEVTINTASVDSNYAERDRHLRGSDLLDVKQFPQARFVSTGFRQNSDGTGVLSGNFTLHGVTRPISIEVVQIGHGPDPWGGYRRGFAGTTSFALADYGITRNLGDKSREVELTLSIEGIRQ